MVFKPARTRICVHRDNVRRRRIEDVSAIEKKGDLPLRAETSTIDNGNIRAAALSL